MIYTTLSCSVSGSRPVSFAATLPHNYTTPQGQFIWFDCLRVEWDVPLMPSLEYHIYFTELLRRKRSVPNRNHLAIRTMAGKKRPYLCPVLH